MATIYDTKTEPLSRTGFRLAIPGRTLVAGLTAAVLMAAGAFWILSPAGFVSTDDAYVKADSTIVAPKVQGLIAAILVRDNQSVRAGQPLIRIDPEDYQQAVDAAAADLASAEATLGQQSAQQSLAEANARAASSGIRAADAERDRANADWKRYDTLLKSDDIARRQADQVRATALGAAADAEKSRAQFVASEQEVSVVARSRAQLEAGVAKARAALSLARQNLSHTLIRAPVSGVVGDRVAQTGEFVGPGTQLMTIVPMSTIYVTANFKETQTARMLVGQRAEVEIDALSGTRLKGEVESFAPASGSEFSLLPFEPATGNFTRVVQRVPVRIRLFQGQRGLDRLRPGLSADVTVQLADH